MDRHARHTHYPHPPPSLPSPLLSLPVSPPSSLSTTTTTRLNQVAFPFCRDQLRSRAQWLTCRCSGEHAGAARVRWEQMAIQMVLASVRRNQRTATRTGGEARDVLHGQVLGAPLAPLPEVAGWQVRLERHVMEDLGSVCPIVQILDLPVPQMVESVTDTLADPGFPDCRGFPCPSRSLIPEPQSAEQWVEVPTVLSPLRIAEQIVGTPVCLGRVKRQVQSSLLGQSTAATHSSGKRISQRIVEQIRSLIFLLVVALGRVRPHLLVLQMRILLGVFRTFPQNRKKVRSWVRARV